MKLFTKSYSKDFPWLKLSIKSVLKMSKNSVIWVIVVENGEHNMVQPYINQAIQESVEGKGFFQVFEVQDHFSDALAIQSGYMRQQWIKMNAHRVMGTDLFWNWDSDVIAVRPLSADTFKSSEGKPIYYFSQLNHLISSERDPGAVAAHHSRRSLTEMCLDFHHISFEYMRCMPSPLIGGILQHASGQPDWARAYKIMASGDHRFSEFNLIGAFSHLYFPDAFDWRNAEQSGPTWAGGYTIEHGKAIFQAHAKISQNWSWGSIPPEVEAYVQAL